MADELRSSKTNDELKRAHEQREKERSASQLQQEKDHAEVDKKVDERVAKLGEQSSDALSAAAASGDARVQNLLGARAVAVTNGDEKAVKEIDGKIKDLV